MAFGSKDPKADPAPRRTVSPAVPNLPDVVTPAKPAPVAEADPWAGLMDAPVSGTYTRGARAVDLEKDIPKPIRDVLEWSYSHYTVEITLPNGAVLKENTPKYRDFDAKTEAAANELIKLIKKWAKHRFPQVSARAFTLVKATPPRPAVVHFAVMPLNRNDAETLPGSTVKPE